MRFFTSLIGFVCGVIATLVFVFIIWVNDELRKDDPTYHVVTTKHFSGIKIPSLEYQLQVYAVYDKPSNAYEIFSKVAIGSGMYFHDLGYLGKANSLSEAMNNVSQISITDEKVSFMYSNSKEVSVSRKELETHR